MKLVMGILAVALFTGGLISCSNDDDSNMTPPSGSETTRFLATLNGASETPANPSTASGNAELIFNNVNKTFYITVTYSGLTVSDGHIHKGAVGVSGPPVFAFTNLTSPITYTSGTLSTEQETDLKNNMYYVNLHTAAYPDGEIRGQLIKQGTSGGGGGGGGGGGY